jgi:DNA-binding transcriptional regulator YiaG
VEYTKKLETIGDHIRKWRINNHLFQADVAKRLGVCEDTIVGWEMRNIKPSVRQVPGITQLIGYLPIEVDSSTFGGRIAIYRYKQGITPKELGLLVSADASTVRAWEAGKNTPHKNRIRHIEESLLISNPELNTVK